ncbi:hypothetical protein [Azospirillum argentinense]|uniref:hypothetical protein n=1 Tax=Azospirillum argentinense TaxID=2970906 RepID=UPI0032E04DF7
MDIRVSIEADEGINPEAAGMLAVVGMVMGMVEELHRSDPSLTANQAAGCKANWRIVLPKREE